MNNLCGQTCQIPCKLCRTSESVCLGTDRTSTQRAKTDAIPYVRNVMKFNWVDWKAILADHYVWYECEMREINRYPPPSLLLMYKCATFQTDNLHFKVLLTQPSTCLAKNFKLKSSVILPFVIDVLLSIYSVGCL